MKAILLGYRIGRFQALDDSHIGYELNVNRIWLFGLIKRNDTVLTSVPVHRTEQFTAYWDKLIESGEVINI